MQSVIEIRHYVNRAGKDVFDDWLTQRGHPRPSEDRDTNQPARCRKLRRLQVATAGSIRAASRLGTRLPRVLRDDRQGVRAASLRR